MSGFLYYLPGGGTQDGFTARGLGHLADASVSINSISGGPDGGAGLIVTPPDAQGPHYGEYHHNSQTWVKYPGFWLGWYTTNPPSAADVALPNPIGGHAVALEKGWIVTVPTARRFPSGTALPQAMVLGADGQTLEAKPLARFAALTGGAQRIFDVLTGEGDAVLPYQDLWQTVTAALALNYRISGAELSALELVTDQNLEAMAEALVDWPTLRAALADDLEKKSTQADASLRTGGPG